MADRLCGRLQSGKGGFNSLSWLNHKRFDSFHNQIYKGAKAQGILTNMPSYLNNGVEQMKAAEHALEGLAEPNRQYAKDFENYLQVLNRKPRTIGRRILELAWVLQHLGKSTSKLYDYAGDWLCVDCLNVRQHQNDELYTGEY